MSDDVCGDKRGTVTGARRHRYRKERPCSDCLPAEREYVRGYVADWRKGRPRSRAARTEAILLDLIAEQRELHHRMGFACSLCVTEWPCQCVESLDCAEARLWEIGGGDADV